MDIHQMLDWLWGVALAFAVWVAKSLQDKPNRSEVRELIEDKQEQYAVYVQELKEDIKRIELKLDKLIEKE